MLKKYNQIFEIHGDIDPYGEEDDWDDIHSDDRTINLILSKLKKAPSHLNINISKEKEILEKHIGDDFKKFGIYHGECFRGIYWARSEREAILLWFIKTNDWNGLNQYNLTAKIIDMKFVENKISELENQIWDLQDELSLYQQIEDI